MSDQVVTASAKAKNFLDSISDRFQDWIPKNLNIWIISLTCLIVIVALSRLLSLQKAVSELQSRPSVDEYLVRQVVRQHLEETVKAMDQQNRIQLQMRQQQMMEQAQKAHKAMVEKQQQAAAAQQAQIQPSGPTIEVIEDSAKKVESTEPVEAEKPTEEVIIVKEEVKVEVKEEAPSVVIAEVKEDEALEIKSIETKSPVERKQRRLNNKGKQNTVQI